jgi:hypothetical protein
MEPVPVGEALVEYDVDHWLASGPTRRGHLRLYTNALEFASTDEGYHDIKFRFPLSLAYAEIKPKPFDDWMEVRQGTTGKQFRLRGDPALLTRIATDISDAKAGRLAPSARPRVAERTNGAGDEFERSMAPYGLDRRTLSWMNDKLRTQSERNIRTGNATNLLRGHVFLRYVGSDSFSFGNVRLRPGDIVHFEELDGIVYDAKLETIVTSHDFLPGRKLFFSD